MNFRSLGVRQISMTSKEFNTWIQGISRLNHNQRNQCIAEINKAGPTDPQQLIPQCIAGHKPECCPHCGHDKLWKWGHVNQLQRWRCRQCEKTFNSLTHTPLAGLHNRGKLIPYAEAMIDGRSIRLTADLCGMHPNTSFRWRHRFLKRQAGAQCQGLNGIAECDITYFYDNDKGSRTLERKPRRRGGDGIPGGNGDHLISVITLRDRNGRGAECIAPKEVKMPALNLFKRHLKSNTLLLTDGEQALCAAGKKAMKELNEAAAERNPNAHMALVGLKKSRGNKQSPFNIQSINAFHSQLKKWMVRFNGVATKYLHHYVGWHRHLVEKHHKNDPNLLIQLAFNPLGVNQQFSVT